MDNGVLDQLLLMWKDEHDEMLLTTLEQREQILSLQERIAAIETPFLEVMKELEAQIKPLMVQRGKTYSDLPGVTASYRKGYARVSYDAKQTDMVLGFLRDVLPNAAEQLEKARKESAIPPSVSIKATEG